MKIEEIKKNVLVKLQFVTVGLPTSVLHLGKIIAVDKENRRFKISYLTDNKYQDIFTYDFNECYRFIALTKDEEMTKLLYL